MKCRARRRCGGPVAVVGGCQESCRILLEVVRSRAVHYLWASQDWAEGSQSHR